MAEVEVNSVCSVVLTNEPVVMDKSLEARCKLLNVLIDLVKAGGVLDKLELFGTDGGCGRS